MIAAGGLYWLSRIPVDGSYVSDILPGLLVASIGLGGVFTGVTTAANAGVGEDKAGLAAGLLNTGQQLGAALGLAILSALATARTNSLARTAATTRSPRRRRTATSARCMAGAGLVLAATRHCGARPEHPPEQAGDRGRAGTRPRGLRQVREPLAAPSLNLPVWSE